MQTVSVQVQDGYMPDFLDYVDENENIAVEDENLKLDPYFYERQAKLQQIRSDIKSGKMEMLSEEESEKEIDLLFEKLA